MTLSSKVEMDFLEQVIEESFDTDMTPQEREPLLLRYYTLVLIDTDVDTVNKTIH